MPHLQGVSRDSRSVFPPALDDDIAADNPVRFIDAFVDQLDLEQLGFSGVIATTKGRPAYPPGALVKLNVYGYVNRVRSSWLLENESRRNLEVMWPLKKLTPDHKTIANSPCPCTSDPGERILRVSAYAVLYREDRVRRMSAPKLTEFNLSLVILI